MNENEPTDAPEAEPDAPSTRLPGSAQPGLHVEDGFTVHDADHRLPLEPERDRSNVFGGDVETDFEGSKALAEEAQASRAEQEKADAEAEDEKSKDESHNEDDDKA